MKRFLAYLKGWRGIALITYMWMILMGWAFIYVDMFSTEMRRRFYFVSVLEITLLVSLYICPRLLRWAEGLSVMPGNNGSLSIRRVFLKSWLINFLFFLVMYLIFYPGGFSSDNIGQYLQAMGLSNYHDHHPVFHTLFAFALPLKLSGGWFGSVNLFQLTLFSLAIAYSFSTLYQYGNYKYAKRSFLYILLNPATFSMAITPLKDTSYAISALVLMTFAVRIYFTRGEWLKNALHATVFLVVLIAGTLFRHNGILFTLPILFAVSLFTNKKRAILMFTCFISMIYIIRFPLYDWLKVDKSSDTRQIEALGLPMTIIGNAVKEEPERLDQEVLDFAYEVASRDIWDNFFTIYKQYDRIKLLQHSKIAEEKEAANYRNNQAIERAGWKRVLFLTMRCFKEAPMPSLTALLTSTQMVWGIIGAPLSIARPDVAENPLGIKQANFFRLNFLTDAIRKIVPPTIEGLHGYLYSANFSLQTIIVLMNYVITLLFKHIFWHIGVINLAVIVFILARLRFNRINDWKRLCIALSMLAYNYGTMLVMPAQILRYFYSAFLILPPVLLVLLVDNMAE